MLAQARLGKAANCYCGRDQVLASVDTGLTSKRNRTPTPCQTDGSFPSLVPISRFRPRPDAMALNMFGGLLHLRLMCCRSTGRCARLGLQGLPLPSIAVSASALSWRRQCQSLTAIAGELFSRPLKALAGAYSRTRRHLKPTQTDDRGCCGRQTAAVC